MKLYLTNFANNVDAASSKYDSVEEEEKETGNEHSLQLPRHYGRVFFQRKGELPSVDMHC